MPFDLLYGSFAANPTSTYEETATSGSSKSTADRQYGLSNLGHIALHPTLPLLAVASSMSAEILFFSTETSAYIWNYQFASAERSQASADKGPATDAGFPFITCLEFSKGNRIAAGLSNGTVHLIEQNLAKMMEIVPNSGKSCVTPSAHSIKLLPVTDPGLYVKFVGRITNLAFSPFSEEQEAGAWLAIATERSGIWIWNKTTQQALRVVNTGGIGEGCLRWISLEEAPAKSPKVREPASRQENHLGRSGIHKWGGVFGDAEDMNAIDNCFASPIQRPLSDDVFVQDPLISQPSSSPFLPSHDPHASTAQSRKGQSLMICGTLDGRLRVQKLWHSVTMMQLENHTEVHVGDVAHSQSCVGSILGVANGPIDTLLVHALEYTSNEIKVPILAAFNGNGSSLIRAFKMSLPLSPDNAIERAAPMTDMVDPTSGVWRGIVNKLFSSKTAHRPLTNSHVLQNNSQPIWLTADMSSSKAGLISASSLHPTNLVLTTLRPSEDTFARPKSSQCTLFSIDPYSTSAALRYVDQIKPLVPIAGGSIPYEQSRNQTSIQKGYYSNMLARAGLDSPVFKNRSFKDDMADGPAQVCDHVMSCGQVAWGKGRQHRDLGAFLYEPGSLLDGGLAIAMFELKP